MVAGLISAELYKIAAKCDDIEKYRNTFMNLALPVYSFSEPMPAPKVSSSLVLALRRKLKKSIYFIKKTLEHLLRW